MARNRNSIPTVIIKLSTTPQVGKRLEQLVATGLYGKNAAEAAGRLVERRLEDLIREGFFERLLTSPDNEHPAHGNRPREGKE